jgi:hypothetical protein
MTTAWQITADWHNLDAGSPEERACFAALGIHARGHWLTEGRDALESTLRNAPYLSAYTLAEWLAWNWWRLRWEPQAPGPNWAFAHHLTSIGGGYIWPNISIYCDGERAMLAARPTAERPETPFRYIADMACMVSAVELEQGIELFVDKVLARLAAAKVSNSNLAHIWQDVQRERADPAMAMRRKLEALLGHDPEEADAAVLNQLLADAVQIGMGAVYELAASAGKAGNAAPPTLANLRDMATHMGISGRVQDGVSLSQTALRYSATQTQAWRVGVDMAHALRAQEALGVAPISDTTLTAMLGTNGKALQPNLSANRPDFGFVLADQPQACRFVLRSGWASGRRFELARLLGARLITDADKNLLVATASNTYQQKAQRAFAAELLSPFDTVVAKLEGDFSEESLQDAAQHFQVSPLTIRTQLLNHGVLDRQEIDNEQFALAA